MARSYENDDSNPRNSINDISNEANYRLALITHFSFLRSYGVTERLQE